MPETLPATATLSDKAAEVADRARPGKAVHARRDAGAMRGRIRWCAEPRLETTGWKGQDRRDLARKCRPPFFLLPAAKKVGGHKSSQINDLRL